MKTFVNIFLYIIHLAVTCRAANLPVQCVQIFNLPCENQTALASEFKILKQRGVEIIIFRCFKNPGDRPFKIAPEQNSSGVYFLTDQDPLVADILPDVVQTAHQYGLRCYGWITTRSSQWIIHENPHWKTSKLNIQQARFEKIEQLDIFNHRVQKRLISSIMQLARTNIDGILLQDDLVSRQFDDFETAAWLEYSKKPFQSSDIETLFSIHESGVTYKPRFYQWTFFKSQKIASFIQSIITTVKSARPDLKIALNVYYESFTAPEHSRNWLSQDLELLQNLSIDQFALMAYQTQMREELHLSVQQTNEKLQIGLQNLLTGYLIPPSQILWKIQSEDWNTGKKVNLEELKPNLPKNKNIKAVCVPYRGLDSISNY